MSNITKMDQQEYAAKMGISQPAVAYRIKRGIPLPGVIRIETFKGWYILHFDTQTNIRQAKKSFKKVHK